MSWREFVFGLFILGIVLLIFAYRNWRHIHTTILRRNFTLYDGVMPLAENLKIILQMVIGVGLVGLVLVKLFYRIESAHGGGIIHGIGMLFYLSELSVLEIVGRALAYATAVELAYTLFTPGPDEAVNPLILAVAAAMLLSVAKVENFDISVAAGAAIFTFVLGGLFYIRWEYITKKEDKLTPPLPVAELLPHTQMELKALQYLSDDALWTIAREQMPDDIQARMQVLMDRNSLGQITDEEYRELEGLVERGNRLMVRKAEASGILMERGHKFTQQDFKPKNTKVVQEQKGK